MPNILAEISDIFKINILPDYFHYYFGNLSLSMANKEPITQTTTFNDSLTYGLWE